MALHDKLPGEKAKVREHAERIGKALAELRSVADPVTESTIRVPVPSPNWIIIVAATATRVSAIELPIAAFTDPVLMRSLEDMKYEMGKHMQYEGEANAE